MQMMRAKIGLHIGAVGSRGQGFCCLRAENISVERKALDAFTEKHGVNNSATQFCSRSTGGLFNMANSDSFLSPFEFLPVAQEKTIFKEIFLFYHEMACCVYSLESSHRCDSNEYTQHTIIV